MDWERVCGSAESGIWVLKGDARARVLPANLDRLRVEWRQHETAWVTPGYDCRVHMRMDVEQQSDPQTKDFIWKGVISLWGTLVCKRECANGSESEPVRWFRFIHPLAQR